MFQIGFCRWLEEGGSTNVWFEYGLNIKKIFNTIIKQFIKYFPAISCSEKNFEGADSALAKTAIIEVNFVSDLGLF